MKQNIKGYSGLYSTSQRKYWNIMSKKESSIKLVVVAIRKREQEK